MMPVRALPGLLATLNVTVPFPVPLEPAVMVIHVSVSTAVQAHPAPAVTAIEKPVPPFLTIDWLVGLMPYAQPSVWVTENV
jgi:hypothetical protein